MGAEGLEQGQMLENSKRKGHTGSEVIVLTLVEERSVLLCWLVL